MAMSRFLRPLKLQERQAYLFNDYWEDIGTIRSFFEANLAFTEHPPRFSFYDAAKPMYTSRRNLPPTEIDNSKIVDSIISHGCFMTNSSIEHSVIGIRSRINSNIHLKDSVMLGADYYETDTEVATLLAEGRVPIGIGENTKINDCIIDKNARIGKNVVIANSVGIQEADRSSQGFYIRSGITIVLKNLVTCCKHEYHLHCILEWSQRSKECPICWQSLALKDPASQELLAAVEAEKCLRSRNVYSSSITNSRMPFERLNDDHDDSCSDDSDFDEQIMQHLVAAASRARFVQRQKRQGSSGAGPSEILVFNSSMHVSGVQPTRTTSPSGGSSPTPGAPLSVDMQHPTSAFSVIVDEEVARNTSPETDVPYRHRVLYSQQPPESARRLNTSEMFSFPESIKSKFSAASARYKESISKSTRGLKEKLLARNATVKELSKGVQREMNAGIAGVARMIERLDLTSRRSNSPLIPVCTEGTSGFPKEGKSAEENGIGHSPNEESGDVNVIHDVSSDAPSLVSSMVAGRMEIPSCVQSGHDAVKT